MNFDLSILIWMQETFGPESWAYWNLITDLGAPPMLVLIIGLTLWIGGTARGLRLLAAVMLNMVVVSLLKVLIVQPRPYYAYEAVQPWRDSGGFGMPSGHASGAMSLWGIMALWLRRWWIVCGIASLIFLIGVSRIYFGVHTPSQVLVGWGVGAGIVWAIWRYEKSATALFKSFGLWTQLAVAVASILLLVGLQTTLIADRAATFEVPLQWTERYNEARVFEDVLDGDYETEFRPLVLFDAFGADSFGVLFGMWLLMIYVTHRGSFENFSRREQVANVIVGMLFVGVLIPLMGLVENLFVLSLILWTAIPMGIGVGVPLVGQRLSQQENWFAKNVKKQESGRGGIQNHCVEKRLN